MRGIIIEMIITVKTMMMMISLANADILLAKLSAQFHALILF